MDPQRRQHRAFTLLELLVTVTVIGVLAALLLPALARAKEKAKVVKAHVELYGVGLALVLYTDDHDGQLPPVRVDCNTNRRCPGWCGVWAPARPASRAGTSTRRWPGPAGIAGRGAGA